MSSYKHDPAAGEPSRGPYEQLVAVIRRLRRECPWDRVQTHASARHLLVEEAYETVDAIELQDYQELKKELGDLVLQVIFHSIMAEEEGHFTLVSVMEAVREKLIRRHPHVYGEAAVDGVSDVLRNWEEIKRSERQAGLILDGVPAHLPALLAAHRMQEKVAGVGFDFSSAAEAWTKVEEELQEYHHTDGGGNAEAEFGDLLFALVNYARHAGINAENALRFANRKFRRRFSYIESQLSGRDLRSVSLEEMDRYWEAAKQQEGFPADKGALPEHGTAQAAPPKAQAVPSESCAAQPVNRAGAAGDQDTIAEVRGAATRRTDAR